MGNGERTESGVVLVWWSGLGEREKGRRGEREKKRCELLESNLVGRRIF